MQADSVRKSDLNTPGCVRIKIIGVGGAGNNAVDRLKLENLASLNLAVVNTDTKTLSASPIEEKVLIGRSITMGLSSGGDAEIGRTAAEADIGSLEQLVAGTDVIFLLAGLGRGTGSGATPVIAELAQRAGALVIAFATMPFSREGARRHKLAEDALVRLREHCHAVISLPNDLLLQQIGDEATVMEAFTIADNWISQGVRSICSMLCQQGLINVDLADLRKAFEKRGGKTLFGVGVGEGEDYVNDALRDLDLCPLLHIPENRYMRRADSLILNITGGPDLSMARVNEIMDYVSEKFGSKDNTVLGAVIEGSSSRRIQITVIGTTDMGGARKGYASVPSASLPTNRTEHRSTVRSVGASTESAATHSVTSAEENASVRKRSAARSGRRPEEQEEFEFPGDGENRGCFGVTEANLYEGEDLDVPTYLRRGIKIPLG